MDTSAERGNDAEKAYPGDISRWGGPTNEALTVRREKSHRAHGATKEVIWILLKSTATQWLNDKCPQLGAALAYFTIFSLAPLVLILLAFFGLFFGSEHARDNTHTYGSRVEPEDHAVRVKRLEIELPRPETDQILQKK
jgi:hypothetical protein